MERSWILAAAPLLFAGQALAANDMDARNDAQKHVNEAAKVVAKMKRDPGLEQAIARCKGVFIMPEYGRAALVVGAHGANGVLLVRNQGKWSGPALYRVGGLSIGAQAGASGGQAAMLLMSDKAVRQFQRDNDFALDADAGITVVKWSAKAHARTGGDVLAWSDQAGAYAGASVGVSDVNFDENETAALYGRQVKPSEIIKGGAAPQGGIATDLTRELG